MPKVGYSNVQKTDISRNIILSNVVDFKWVQRCVGESAHLAKKDRHFSGYAGGIIKSHSNGEI